MKKLDGKIALVTGGSRGIGRAIAVGLAKEGASVIINYINNHQAANETLVLAEKAGGQGLTIQADTSKIKQVEAMFKQVSSEFSRLDILVNNAGVVSWEDFTEITEEEWDRVININVKGYFLCGQQAARIMVKQEYGRIINVSSNTQVDPAVRRVHYGVSKGAVGMLTKGMALELAPHNITVNGIAPGPTITDFTEPVLSVPEYRAAALERVPLGRFAEPEEMTGTVILLASEQGSYITGQTIFIDGGTIL